MTDKKKDVGTEVSYYVVKSNTLIQKSRYNLSLQAQRCLLYAISKIRPNDTVKTQYTISIRDLCAACGINIDTHGSYYEIIKKELKELRDKSIWIVNEKGNEETVSWFSKVVINRGERTATIKFDETIQDYLFLLQSRYTQYRLSWVLCLKSKYSIRLLQLILSYYTKTERDNREQKEIRFDPEELKERLGAENYTKYSDFSRFVLLPSITEINELSSEIHIDLYTNKQGRITKEVILVVNHADPYQMRDARLKREEVYKGL